MRKNEEIEAELKANAFLCSEIPDEWTRDDWTVRLYEEEMEIYETTQLNGYGRYLLTEIDLEILKEILDDL